jgi:hypothetical protein
MAKLPSSFRNQNRTTRRFREMLAALPRDVLNLTRAACLLFHRDPAHPSLRHHELSDTRRSKHIPKSFSVSITMQYRAIYVRLGGVNVWYWIGTHADYDAFTGKK